MRIDRPKGDHPISTHCHAPIAAGLRASCLAFATLAAASPALSASIDVDPESARDVCSNWIQRLAAGSSQARGFERTIAAQHTLADDRGVIGHLFQLAPGGWVVVPARRTLSPIVAWAETGELEFDAEAGLPLLVREQLTRTTARPEAAAPEWRARAWADLASPAARGGLPEDDAGATMIEQGGPLLQSSWHQGEPFQDFCPMGDGGRTVVGCVATAGAQILRYYQWPPSGEGTFSYAWRGDVSCHGAAVPSVLSADFSDPYDWANMPLVTGEDETPAQRAAVAELCYEMAVALEMSFGRCNSASNPEGIQAALVQHFRFNPSLEAVTRLSRSRPRWYELIQEEIDRGRPLFYNITSHALVTDGYQKVDTQLFYHVNYGWGGSNNAWFAIDEVPGLADPLLEFMVRRIAPAEQVHHLRPDGAGAFRSLADALVGVLDSEIIELDDGIYRGDGFRDLVLPDRPLIIRSRSGDPERCIIDAAASDGDPHSIIARLPTAPPGVTIEGITFRGAHDTRPGGKGAILCNGGQTRFINCRFENNRGATEGGAVYISEARPVFEDCVFVGNEPHGVECFDSAPVFRRCIFSGHDRSSLRAHQSDVILEQCTFAWNRAREGDLRVHSLADLVARNCLFAFSGGQTVNSRIGRVRFESCDVYGNAAGDYVGGIAGQDGHDGNLRQDPLFCEAPEPRTVFTLRADSPCAGSEGDPSSGIGALGIGCGRPTTAVEAPAGTFLGVFPSPTSGQCRIACRAGVAVPGTLTIHDPGGRLVREIHTGRFAPGVTTFDWDGRTASGELAPSGVYFARWVTDRDLQTHRFVIVR